MAFLALKPVRFDKDYAIGEIIPDGVVAPAMSRRLTEWGKIAVLPTQAEPEQAATQAAPEAAEQPEKPEGGAVAQQADAGNDAASDGTLAQGDTEKPPEAAQAAPEAAEQPAPKQRAKK